MTIVTITDAMAAHEARSAHRGIVEVGFRLSGLDACGVRFPVLEMERVGRVEVGVVTLVCAVIEQESEVPQARHRGVVAVRGAHLSVVLEVPLAGDGSALRAVVPVPLRDLVLIAALRLDARGLPCEPSHVKWGGEGPGADVHRRWSCAHRREDSAGLRRFEGLEVARLER